jgi:ADP-ribosylglycohydrolase
MDCKDILINKELYTQLFFKNPNPCNTKTWITNITPSNIQQNIKIITLNFDNNNYSLKTDDLTILSKEQNILSILREKMFNGDCPLVFPFAYSIYPCDNDLNIIFQNSTRTLESVMNIKHSINWWYTVLYQITKGLTYLEKLGIKHNNLNTKNIVFQKYSTEPDNIAIMIINFEKALLNFYPTDYKQTDLYTLIYELYNKYYQQIPPKILELFNIPSSKLLSRQIVYNDTNVSYYCSIERQNKLIGLSLGSLLGDTAGMPVLFDKSNKLIQNLQPSQNYQGFYAMQKLQAGTFTTPTRLAIALIVSLSNPANIILNRIDVNNIKFLLNYTYTAYPNLYYSDKFVYQTGKPTSSLDFSCLMYSWLIIIFDNNMTIENVINDTIKVCKVMTTNTQVIWTAVFINCILFNLLNETNDLEKAVNQAKQLISSKTNSQPAFLDLLTDLYNVKSYQEGITLIMNKKNNSTLNTTIMGTILGVLFGYSKLPVDWINIINKPNIYNEYNGLQITTTVFVEYILNLCNC